MLLACHENNYSAQNLAKILCESYGVGALAVQADVSDRQSVNEMFDAIDNTMGSIDVLVNNSGIAQQKLFTDITAEDWKAMLGVNLDGVYNCIPRRKFKRFQLTARSIKIC